MITMDFLRGVLNGEKLFLKMSEVKIIDHIPRYPEIDTKLIWEQVKKHKTVQKYFADSFVNLKRVPNRTFLFTVFSIGAFDSFYR